MSRWIMILFLLFPFSASASENCVGQFGGICRDACAPGEEAAEGAFIDCTDKQDCCVLRSSAAKPDATASSPVLIIIEGSSFAPASITVKAGTEVIWKNKDSAPHTVTADDGSFDSGSMGQGDEFRKKLVKPGTLSYSCDIHAYMSGKIVVTP